MSVRTCSYGFISVLNFSFCFFFCVLVWPKLASHIQSSSQSWFVGFSSLLTFSAFSFNAPARLTAMEDREKAKAGNDVHTLQSFFVQVMSCIALHCCFAIPVTVNAVPSFSLTGNSAYFKPPSVFHLGARILLAGLAIALSVFVFFLFMLGYLHINMRRNSDRSSLQLKSERVLIVLYVDMILLIIRSAYRVAEYGNMEHHNSIRSNEGLFYGLDATMMMLLNLLWVPFHPG